jgi:two-component sensor histidine kinase
MQVSWASSSLVNTVRRATEPYDGQGTGRFSFEGPEIGITSGAVIALAMTLNELCTNYEIRCAVCARRTGRNRVDERRRNSAAPTDMD